MYGTAPHDNWKYLPIYFDDKPKHLHRAELAFNYRENEKYILDAVRDIPAEINAEILRLLISAEKQLS